MKKLILILVALVALVASNCNTPRPPAPPNPTADAAPPALDAAPAPAPIPTPPVDAGPVPVPLTPVGAACFNLAAVGCSDGKAPNCVATLQHVVDFQAANHKRAPPLDCLAHAGSVSAAKACGLVGCR